jgi:hypothetical protein
MDEVAIANLKAYDVCQTSLYAVNAVDRDAYLIVQVMW